MKENITTELSNALKNGDKERIHTLRLVLAAIKIKKLQVDPQEKILPFQMIRLLVFSKKW